MFEVTSLPQIHPVVGTPPVSEEVPFLYPKNPRKRVDDLRSGKDELEKFYQNGDDLRVVLLSICLCEDLVRSCFPWGMVHTSRLWDLTKELQQRGSLGYHLSSDLGLMWRCRTGLTHHFHRNLSLVTRKRSEWFRDVFHRTWDRLGGDR